jgi:hypothetical protein
MLPSMKVFRSATPRIPSAAVWVFVTCLLFVAVTGCSSHAGRESTPPREPAYVKPEHKIGSAQTYPARHVSPANIELDGVADEPAWAQAVVEKHFVFPWKPGPAPATEFRALWDDENFYFSFRVQDADIVVVENFRDPKDAVLEDRVEFYLCRDERMKDCYCVEIDSRGRVLDYHASYYRNFNFDWDFAGLETQASPRPDGYEVEGRIPLQSITALGFPPIRAGVKARFGIFRAEFSHDRSGRKVEPAETIHNLGRKLAGPPPIEEWISWVDPKISEPDFHVPASLGWLEFVK